MSCHAVRQLASPESQATFALIEQSRASKDLLFDLLIVFLIIKICKGTFKSDATVA